VECVPRRFRGNGTWIPPPPNTPDELLRTPENRLIPVEAITLPRMEQTTVYNVEVEEFHSYFAGKGEAVWSHNGAEGSCGVPKAAVGEETVGQPAAMPAAGNRDIHRIGGASVENLRLKPKEAKLNPPGISVLKTPTPGEAAAEMRAAYPDATGLHEAAKTVGSSTTEAIRGAGFDVIPTPSRRLPNHYRLIHPEGVAGFTDENLARLAQVFTNTTGN
jgi:hypothetical protein